MKNLIKTLIVIAIISLSALRSQAQTSNGSTGIYLTEQDYKSHKLTYTLSPTDKMQLNEFLDGKNVTLVYQGKKLTLPKSGLFGYRLHNQDFRFFHNEAYSIVDTAGFMLYKKDKLTQQGKGYMPVERYFYSVNLNQSIHELTIENLWNSFPGQTGLRYSIQNNFKQDADLAAYDKFAHQYKLKYLYFQQKEVAAHASL
ncbi:hypothetical protein [Mucilaginibacter sp.]|uniref:hypothetical protein n=1 Tax=Mucilaginibacter sp. TaxID=1882438 RepID=UPI00260B8416|nr:hypothetical protein [Mucilaginibacter sp.]MDB4921970.1 hypothetical protein [Mucilaginibacter sp.]